MASAEIIFGEPTNVDGFEGGGHAKSAGALVDGITRIANKPDRDENGRLNQHLGGAIGLEGAWGSGKSTVIEIAEKSLGPKFHVFTFDLWRHQSDDFRRALLEEFLDYLKGLSEKPDLKIDKKKIAKERKAVRNRQTITTTTSKRRYTVSGLIAILVLPLLPLLYSWAQPAAFVAAGKVADPSQPAALIEANRLPIDPMWTIYILVGYLALFPLIAFISYRLIPEDEKEKDSEEPWWRRWFTEGASHFLTLSRKEKTNEDIKTVRDEDPTTVEFREVFQRILKPVQVDGRRVVFVLDNVDRLPEQDVQRVWSDMRSLVAKSGKDKSAAVIAVIPYDRNQVARAFPALEVTKKRNSDGAIGDAVHGEGADAPIVIESDVFEKTFDRLVKVSAPVPSNWKAYLNTTIEKAFGGQHDSDAVEKLFRLLKYKLDLERAHPTPRRIISYVNDIGSLWVQWGDEGIPVATIGLYALHRPAFDRDPGLLSKADPVDLRFQRIVDDENYARNLAALAFNVAPALANQVRLGQPINDALLSKDGPQKLKDLSTSAGFNELFQDELRQRLTDWAANSPESISRAAMNVDQMELPIETEGAIWQIFADGAAAIDKLDYPQSRLAGLHVIVRRQTRMSPEAIAGQLRKKFEATKVAEKDSAFKQGAEWYGMQRSLSEAIVAATDPRRGTKFWTTSVPTDNPDFNLGVVSAHERDDGLPFSGIRLGLSEDKLSSALLEMLKVNSAGYAHCMLVVGFRVEKYAKAHLESIAVELSSEPDEKRMRLFYAAARIMQWSMPETLREAFDAIAGDSLLKYLEWAADTGTQEDYAMSVYVAAAANDGVEIESSRGFSLPDHAVRFNDLLKDASADDEMIEYLVVQIERNAEASAWLGWALDSGSEQGLYRRTVRAMTGVTKIRLRNLLMIAENFSALVVMVGQEGAAFFLSQFEGREEEIQKVFGDSNVVRVPSDMIAALSKMDDTASARTILSLIEGYLVSLDANDWHSALTNPASEDLRLLSAMSEFSRLELKSPDFIRGLVAMCTDVIEGKFDPASIGSVWPQVQKAISPSQYTPLRAQVVAGMRSVTISPNGSVSFVRHLGIIAQKMRFSVDQSTADMALTRFLWNLVNSDDDAATRYLEANASEIELTLKAASRDDVRQAYLGVSRPERGKD